MPFPVLNDLPQPPPNKTGWPWTEEGAQLSGVMPDGSWPRISIVTPSYNQGEFVEETIRSVLLQGYPNLEYIIIDGGSDDQSVEIICKYEPWLTYWVSESDQGQAHAINKGFAKCTGDLIAWINSDDLLLPGALEKFALAFRQSPGAILLGDVVHFSETGLQQLARQKNVTLENLIDIWKLYGRNVLWNQQGTYVPQKLHRQIGDLDEGLRYVFDLDWMIRLLQFAPVHYLHQPIACFRMHDTSKTVSEMPLWFSEQALIMQRYQNKLDLDENSVQAKLEMYRAFISLSVNYWDRKKGIIHLIKALNYDWRIILSFDSLLLWTRAMMPLRLLHRIKKSSIGRKSPLPVEIYDHHHA